MYRVQSMSAAVLATVVSCAVAYERPNIVMFLADDIGWSDFGYFGYDLKVDNYSATPTIDYLAEQGVKLACVYGGTACTPGRAAFLTGRYPMRTGLQGGAIKATQKKGIFMNMSLVSDEMKQAGYATAMVGKWHVGCAAWEQTPIYRGFDTFYGFIANGQMDFLSKMNDNYYDLYKDADYETDESALSQDVRVSWLYDAHAEDFIRSQTNDKPWFLYYAFQDPHTPLSSPEYFLEQEPCASMTDSTRQVYCGMMRCIDTSVEGVMAAVSESGFLDNTLVIFAGDNGGAPKNGGYNWPLRGSKGTLFEGGIRQASFAWGAMLSDTVRGTTYHGALHLVDFYPTFLSIATGGHWVPPEGEILDGVDNWDAISTGASSARQETLLNAYGDSGGIRVGDYVLLYNCKSDDWYAPPGSYSTNSNGVSVADTSKLISDYLQENGFPTPDAAYGVAGAGNDMEAEKNDDNGNGGYMLFDLATDPYEYTDLSSTYPDLVTELADLLNVYISEQVDSSYDSDKYNDASSMAAATGYWGPWLGQCLPDSPNCNANVAENADKK
eukprot:m.25893 g.25893  ORF g.25893 m.25893 type:complete len:553 (-) comp13226_c0_seq8:1291-2949(-)